MLLLLAPIGAVLLVVGAERVLAPDEIDGASVLAPPLAPDDLVARAFGPADYDSALARSGEALALGRERVANGPGEWLREESLAAALLGQFSLSGDYRQLTEAGELLADAGDRAPKGSGPWLRQAAFAMTVHDLSAATTALDGAEAMAVPPSVADRGEIAALRGDIAFYRGDMTRAAQDYAAARIAGNSQAFRRAALARVSGRFDEAISLFAVAAREGSGTPLAQARIALQIGVTESARGNYAQAQTWYRAADRLLPGYPLTRLYLAEAQALSGDVPAAIAEMEEVANEYQWPEAMDAVAMLHRTQGNRAESRAWSRRAGAGWQDRMRLSPRAARAHAVEHDLAFGDPRRALALARQEVASRPYGAARILLANALIANGRAAEAVEQLRAAEQGGWRSAPLYAAMAEAQAQLGDGDAAQAASDQAEAINPRIFDGNRAVIWFGHG